MALPTCPTPTAAQYRPFLSALHVTSDEEPHVLPLLSDLDGLDGVCDGKLSPITYDGLRLASDRITALPLSSQRRVALREGLRKFIVPNDFSAFVSRPYHEVIQFLRANPMFADVVLPHIHPGGFWSDDLSVRLKDIRGFPPLMSEAYPQLVDALFDRSGLAPLHAMLDIAERVRIREGAVSRGDASVFTSGATKSASPSHVRLMGFLDMPALPDWKRVNPTLIGALRTQKDRAEEVFVSTLNEKMESLPDVIRRDPIVYWTPLVKLVTTEPEFSEKSPAHYGVLKSLFTKARALAYDDVMGILFDVEYADFIGEPLDIAALDRKIADVRRNIAGVNQEHYTLPNGLVESGRERVGRYYSTIGHLLTRKYGAAISLLTQPVPTDPKEPAADVAAKIAGKNAATIAQTEIEIEALLQERRDKTTVDEALVYADAVDLVASVWSVEGGMMSRKLMMEGLPAVHAELARLALFQKRFETLCNGHLGDIGGGESLREKMADIRWKMLGESFFRAGLPKEGLSNLDSEPSKYQNTKAYGAHVRALGVKYPWLVDKANRIVLTEVGDHGKEAEAITAALFYASRNTGREVGLPVVGGVIGSLGGPLGTIAGGYAGKAANRLINAASGDAPMILSQARATGIPLISESVSEQLSREEYIDLGLCGFSSFLMFRFYRSGLSLMRAATQASSKFVMSGGVPRAVRTTVAAMTRENIRTAGQALGMRIVKGAGEVVPTIRQIPGKVVETYGKSGVWPFVKYMWTTYGVPMRVTTAGGLMLGDYVPDREFNTWAGPLGASLLINDVYGKVVWGWDANGGMVGFFWRYVIELGVQHMQGIPITTPRMDYTVAGMLSAYTLRGVNKLYTLGRVETHKSPILDRLAHFVEEHDVWVPRSVVGLSRIKAQNGLVRGLATRIGKPPKKMDAAMPDGTILRVVEAGKTKDEYIVHVVRKMTDPKGRPVSVVTETLRGRPIDSIEEVTEMRLPRASEWGRKMYRTVHLSLSEAGVYRLPNAIMKMLRIKPQWWTKWGEMTGTADKPIFNFRGSLANAGDLPILALVGAGFGILQNSDPKMQGLYRASDYGISFFFQHKIQHLFKIDSPLGSFLGYALGIPFSVLSLPKIFPTTINTAPALTKKCEPRSKWVEEIIGPCDEGYFVSLMAGDDEGANKALQLGVTSMAPLANAPIIGPGIWNKITPFGTVEGSNYRIEEVGAVAYWNTMLKKLHGADSDRQSKAVMMRLIDKVARDSTRYLVDHDLPEDPVRLRLLVLELAFMKRLMHEKNHRDLVRHAHSFVVLKEAVANVPMIRTNEDLRQMVMALNVNERRGTLDVQ